jgi:hypothetical protein
MSRTATIGFVPEAATSVPSGAWRDALHQSPYYTKARYTSSHELDLVRIFVQQTVHMWMQILPVHNGFTSSCGASFDHRE